MINTDKLIEKKYLMVSKGIFQEAKQLIINTN